MELYSVFEIEHNRFIGRDENDNGIVEWKKELNFYLGDLSSVDIDIDNRFKEVKEKRRNAIFLGIVATEFPIQYPIILNNGYVCQDIYDRVDSNEPDYNETI